MDDYFEDDVRTNRQKKMCPRKDKFYCWHCDGALVGEWSKCPVCGKRSGSKRRKKD